MIFMKLSSHTASKPRFNVRQYRTRQKGITLIIGLILLMMLTVVGTIGYRNTTLSERMSSGVRDRNLAFQAAESAGQEAISELQGTTSFTLNVGYYATPLPNGGNAQYWINGAGPVVADTTQCAAQQTFSWTSCARNVSTKYTDNASTTSYVIEQLSSVTSTNSVSAVITYDTFRLTTRSTGGSNNSDVVLQSIFTRVSP
jgi:type IV pilus assembly protein PilX